jgi:mechanosensitive ion channel-like protein
MDDIVRRIIVEPFQVFLDRLLMFLPSMLHALFILLAGIVVAIVARVIVSKLLQAVGLDKEAQKWGIVELLAKGGVKGSFSSLVGRLAFWLLLIMFILMSLDAVNVPERSTLFSRFFLYLPNILVAAAVITVGYIASSFLGKAVLVWAVNLNLGMAGFIAKVVKITVMFLALTMALEQLGIGSITVLILFSLLFGGLVLGLAIAFGLGGRDLAKDFLEKRLKEHGEKKDEIHHL